MFFDRAFAALLNALLLCSLITRVIAAPGIPLPGGLSIPTSPLDFGVDYTKDPFPPYPPLTNPDGSNITVENLRGTRLYGWKGCGSPERNDITQAFDDFYTLSQQPEVYNSIGWTGLAARQFFGPEVGRNSIPDKRKKEIQRRFLAESDLPGS
jgi:hypothetical protein